jgi:4-amino-4-deoxy-L-arabinose transferase-like glycosyltransferase
MVLAAFDLLGLHSVDEQRILLAVIGAVGVLLVGLVARRVGGPAVGLIAAAIAALDPLWFQPGAAVMSESIYLVAIPAILLVAIGCVDHPGRIRFALLGGSCAVAVLIRSDALLFSVVLGVPLVLFISRSGRERLAFARCFLAGLALVLSPWLIRNEIQVGGVTLSDNGGGTVAGSYCPPQLNPHLFNYGGFNGPCAEGATGFLVKEVPPPNHARSWTELEINNALWSSTQPYIRAHLSALPSLALARIENTWGLARTTQNVYQGAIEGRVLSFERFGLELGRVLLVFELVGAVLLFRRSRARLYILMAPLVAVTIDSALFYGTTRFLALGLPSLTVLAALGLNAAVAWLRRRLAAPPHQRSAVEPAFAVAGQDRSEEPAGVAGMTPHPPG